MSACALVDPYAPGLNAGLYDSRMPKNSCPKGNEDSFTGPNALKCADERSTRLQRKYLHAAGQHEIARTLTAGAIIGGSSYALLLGVADGIAAANAKEQIAAIGAGAAALFALNNFVTSPRRQDIYIEGTKAIVCTQIAAAPYFLTTDQREVLTERDGATLASLVASAESELDKFRGAGSNGARHRTLIEQADMAVSAGKQTANRAAGLVHAADVLAPAQMLASLRTINGAVSTELRKSQPDLSTIKTLQTGLAGFASGISGDYVKNEGLDASPPALTSIAGTAETVRLAMRALKQRTIEANAILEAVNEAIAKVGAIDNCGFTIADLPLKIAISEKPFVKGTASSTTFVVERGEAPFVVRLSPPTAGLAAKFSDPFSADGSASFGRVGTVSYDGKAGVRNYDLFINDKAGALGRAAFEVAPAPALAAPADPGIQGDAETAHLQDKAVRQRVQTYLCVDPDGIFGPQTRAKIAEDRAKKNLAATGALSAEEITDILSAAKRLCDG